MEFTPEEQAVLDAAGENKELAIYLILKDRAVKALRALNTIEAIADAVVDAVRREDDDDEDDDHEDDDARLEELIDQLQSH